MTILFFHGGLFLFFSKSPVFMNEESSDFGKISMSGSLELIAGLIYDRKWMSLPTGILDSAEPKCEWMRMCICEP